ncbi:MAG TPA: glycosyltransferase family 2 protein [Terracidiphilus sp.]|nr:glycosyltransferase family 2 protein [Terracidiphilus sp.]
MSLAAGLLLFLIGLLALLWLGQAIAALRGMPTLPDLTQLDPPPSTTPDSDVPDLTVIVPACNEEPNIAATLRSLLASTGLRLEILAVNDRSADRTGAIMDQAAGEAASSASPHTLRILHIADLPEGWLGKPHAMATVAAQASAPWLLFTDGDVLFAPDALARALHFAQAGRADHLVLVPTLIVHSRAEQAMQAAMQVLAQWAVRLWKVADPRARDFIGVGGFNLMRSEAYQSAGGFESLRMEVLDDMRMGWKLKRTGNRSLVVLGPGLVRIRWIAGALSVIRLIEKNGFATYRFRLALHLIASLGLVLQAILPLAAFFAGRWAAIAGAILWLGIGLTYWANRRLTRTGLWAALFFCPCTAIVAYAFLRSMALALMRGGIRWRGTFYPLAILRRNAGSW